MDTPSKNMELASLAGNTIRVKKMNGTYVVVKISANPNADMNAEAAATKSVLGCEGFVQYVGHTRKTLVTKLVVPTTSRWDYRTLEDAGHITRSLPELPNQHSMRIMAHHAGDQEKIGKGLNFTTDRQLGLAVKAAVEELSFWPISELSPAHCDTRPENWVLSDNGPVLLDFGAVGLAPKDWDGALLLAHSIADVGVKNKVAHHLGIDWGLVRLAACFYLGIAWFFKVDTSSPKSTSWSSVYENIFTQVLRHRTCY